MTYQDQQGQSSCKSCDSSCSACDKTNGKSAINMFTLEGCEFISSTLSGVGGLDGRSSGAVASPVAGSKLINSGFAGVQVANPYRSFILLQN